MKRVLKVIWAPLCLVALGILVVSPLVAETVEHEVKRGDTLFSISRKYGVPVDALRDANDIENADAIQVGIRLRIPDQYEVVRGDTLYSIARRHGLSVDRLRNLNRLSEDDILRVGDRLYVPGVGSEDPDAGAVARVERRDGTTDGSDRANGPESQSEHYWPHPGERARTDGKFPGVAIRGDRGDDVIAVAAGTVVYAGPHSSFGRVVFVQSATGHVYVYAGNESIAVEVGDSVEAGNRIGSLGTVPGESAAQLYFGVWKDNRFLDPNDAPRG